MVRVKVKVTVLTLALTLALALTLPLTIAQWGALADEYQQRLDGLQGALAAAQQQAAQLGAENEQLRTHNGQLLEYGERLRAQLQALHEEEQQHAVELQYQQQQQAGVLGVAGAVFT